MSLISIMYELIGDPLLSGAVHAIITSDSTTVVEGIEGVSGTSAARIETVEE